MSQVDAVIEPRYHSDASLLSFVASRCQCRDAPPGPRISDRNDYSAEDTWKIPPPVVEARTVVLRAVNLSNVNHRVKQGKDNLYLFIAATRKIGQIEQA